MARVCLAPARMLRSCFRIVHCTYRCTHGLRDVSTSSPNSINPTLLDTAKSQASGLPDHPNKRSRREKILRPHNRKPSNPAPPEACPSKQGRTTIALSHMRKRAPGASGVFHEHL